MSNSFEFLSTSHKRLRFPRTSLFIFLVMAFLFLFSLALTGLWKNRLLKGNKAAKAKIAQQAEQYISEAKSLLPDRAKIEQLKNKTNSHNRQIGGERSAWTRLFNVLEETLPPEAVILSIKNPKDNSRVFAAQDRQFELVVSVKDMPTANLFYSNISNNRAFGSLSFSPSAESSPGVSAAIQILISFKFNDSHA